MSTDSTAICGGEDLARTLRDLAERAHRLQCRARDGAEVDPDEARELLERIRQARQGVRGNRQDDLRRWLDNLRGQVRAYCASCVCV